MNELGVLPERRRRGEEGGGPISDYFQSFSPGREEGLTTGVVSVKCPAGTSHPTESGVWNYRGQRRRRGWSSVCERDMRKKHFFVAKM